MDFYQLLIAFSVLIFLVITAISIVSIRTLQGPENSLKLPDIRLYYLLFSVLLASTGYSALTGLRNDVWFLLFTLYATVGLFYSRSLDKGEREFAVISTLLMSVVVTTLPILQNNGVIFGPDQWRDLKITGFITDTGKYTPGLMTGYYSFIPLFNIINSALTAVTGWQPMTCFIIVLVVYTTLAILSIYLVIEKVSSSRTASLIAVLVFLSTPRLAMVQAVPFIASTCLGMFLILLMIEQRSNLLFMVPLISFTTTVLHPIGVIPVITISIGVMAVGYVFRNSRLNSQTISYMGLFSTTCVLVTLIYWSLDTRVLTGVFSPLQRLIGILINLEYTSSVYTPQYQESGFQIYAYSWALPVSVAASNLLMFIFYERSQPRSRGLNLSLSTASAGMGLSIIMVSFISMLLSPGAALERYMNVPAYLLLLVPSAMLFPRVFSSSRKYFILIGVLLLSTNIYIGTKSPNWAPFENPTFGAYRSTYMGYLESEDIVKTLPTGVRVYEDNDLPLYELASLENISVTKDRSYQTIRVVIQGYKSNNIDLKNQRIFNSLSYITTSEITDYSLFQEPVDLVYSNGLHSGLKMSDIK